MSAAVLAVTAHLSVREVLQTIVSAARRLVGAQYAALGIPDGNGSFREFVADGLTAEQWRAIGPIPRQHGLLGAMLRDPSPVRSPDIRRHPHFEGWPAAHPEMVGFLGMPVVDGAEILGELFLANKLRPANGRTDTNGGRKAHDPQDAGGEPGGHEHNGTELDNVERDGTEPGGHDHNGTGPDGDGHPPAGPGNGFDAADEELLKLLAAHAAIAIVNARLYERSRELSIVEERQRIARELHDAVTQKLFSLRLTADAAAALVPRDPARAAAELDTVRRLAAEATAELKSIVVGLHPVDLAGDGLAAALQRQAELLDRVHAPRVSFAGDAVPRLPAAREEAAYRIAQEALHNALRHASAAHVAVELRRRGPGVVLTVSDDGDGFDGRLAEPGGGTPRPRLGLASMRERARAAGARLQIRSRPGEGTTVSLEVPGA